ncbi:MAG: hypothetical protein IKR04_04565 [Clostridia bacterium]|nr:hypothetical protein [Clostridia bacterium]
MDNSFLLIKPDGFRYLDVIRKEVLKNGFRIVNKYHIYSWEDVFRKLSRELMEHRNELFGKEIEAHIWLLKYIFGNYAQLWILEKKPLKDEALLEETTNVKEIIRDRYCASRDGTFMIIADMCKVGLPSEFLSPGYLGTFFENEFHKVDKMIPQRGQFDGFYLKYLHCPDPILSEAEREFEVLRKCGIISKENEISEEEWEKMIYFIKLLS